MHHILENTNYIFSKNLKNNFWKTLVYTASIVAVGLLFLAVTLLPKLSDITASAHQPDLRIIKTANKDTVKPGEIITFTITLTNEGDSTFISGHNDMTAYDVSIVDSLPNGFLTIPGNDTSLNWSISQLEAGKTWTKTFDIKVKENIALGGYLNIVTVNAKQKINNSLVTYPAVQASWAVVVEAPNEEPQLPQLTVIKNLINNNGGTATVSDFRLFVGGEEVISGATNTFNPGSYNVSEINLLGYTASAWSGDCEPDGNIVLNAGDNKLCTITNNDIYIPPVFPALNIEKTTNKNVITAGETVIFTIVVNNIGNGPADNLTLFDILPGGFTVINTGNSTIQWNLTSLSPGGSWTKSFTASSVFNLGSGTYVNTATVTADNHSSISDTASVIVQNHPIILTSPSLSIQKIVTPQVTNAGAVVNYTIVVTNMGDGTAFNAVLSDQLPSADFIYTATGTSARSWNLGNILAGGSESRTYTVNIANNVTNGTYVNTATVTADNHSSISDTASVIVQGEILGEEFNPVLLIEKVTNRKRVNPGASVTYTINVTNMGEADAVGLELSDILPEDFSETGTGKTILKWSLPLLEIGDTWQVSYTIKISNDAIEGDYINLAVVSAQNHPKQVKDDYLVEVRRGVVLGDTGVTPLQVFIWIMSFIILILAIFQIIKKRQFIKQLI